MLHFKMCECEIIAIYYSKPLMCPFKLIIPGFFTTVPPDILSDIMDLSDERRDVVNFTCQAIGEPVPNISWYFNGVKIDVSDTSKYMIMSTSINTTTTENKLTVYNATETDVGAYTCNATNIIGSDSSHGESVAKVIMRCFYYNYQVVWLVWIIG